MSFRRVSAALVLCGAAHFFGGTGSAQGAGSTPGGALPADHTENASGPLSYIERTFKVQGSLRARWEATDGSDFSATPADSYLLTRIRIGIAYRPTAWLRFYGEGQDSRAEFYKTVPTNSVTDPMEFRQGYVEGGKLEGNGFKLRMGRQDLVLGSGRLISTGDWSNVTKTFEMGRATYTSKKAIVDVMGGSPLLYDTARADRHKPGEHFYAAYVTLPTLLKKASVEPYFIARTGVNVKGKDGIAGDNDTYIAGLRVIGKLRGGLDYTGEAVRQGGSYGNDKVQAWGYVLGGGWTIPKVGWKLHPNSDYIWASGDDGRKDGHHQSFDCLYGSNQPMNGLTGLYGWRNIGQWRAGADFYPVKQLWVKINFRDVWLATRADGLYNASSVRTVFNAKATSSHVGEGVDIQFIMNATPKNQIGIGVGDMAPGSYLMQSGKKNTFVYPYLSYTRII